MINSHGALNTTPKTFRIMDVDQEWQLLINNLLSNSIEKRLKKEEDRKFVKRLNVKLLSYNNIKRAATRYRILQACVRFLAWLEKQDKTIKNFNAEIAEAYLAFLKGEKGVKDIRAEINMLRHVARVLKKEAEVRECIKYPRYEGPAVKKQDLLTREEVEAIIDNIKNPMYKVMVAVMAETGMRLKEIRSIKLKDVEPRQWGFRIKIRREYTKTPAGERTVAIVEKASMLAKWLELHPCKDPEAYLFPSPRNPYKPQARNTLLIHLKKAALKAGIDKKRVYNHLFRHVRATQLYSLLGKIKPKEYLRIFGWDDLKMLKVYEHLAEDRAEEAYVDVILGEEKKQKEEERLEVKLVKCGQCGFPNPPNTNYCGKCGSPLKQAYIKRLEQEAETYVLIQELAKEIELLKKAISTKLQNIK